MYFNAFKLLSLILKFFLSSSHYLSYKRKASVPSDENKKKEPRKKIKYIVN